MTDYQYYLDYLKDFPFLVQTTWIISIALIITIICLTTYLKILRFSLRKKEKNRLKFRTEYETLLMEYFYSDPENEQADIEQDSIIFKLKKAATVKSQRKVIITILYNLMNEVSGEMSDAIKSIYTKTGLIGYALSSLNDKKWHIVAKGIGELTKFQITEAHDHVIKFIKHPVREVRKEARFYLVNLYRFKGLSFLNEIKTPLSEWDQIQMLEILQNFDDQQICDIKPWLKSTNNTVVLFALKLAHVYNQYEVKDELIELLSHKNKDIRIQATSVLTNLYGIEAKEVLKANFEALSIEEQLSFFEMLEKLVMPSDEPFIEKHLFHKNFEIQLLALKILKSINLDKFMGMEKIASKNEAKEIYEFVNNI